LRAGKMGYGKAVAARLGALSYGEAW